MANSGLGRGLNSLISAKKPENTINKTDDINNISFSDDKDKILHINPELIEANTDQPRSNFNESALEDLVKSIKEHGILQPLVVIKKGDKFELIAGERRLRASKKANLKTVPVIVRSVDKQEKLELSLIENLQRENLSPLETAIAYQKLIDEFSLTQDKVAKKVGKSRPSVANALRLLNLPKEIRDALNEGKITEAHAKEILSLKTPSEQLALFKKIIQHGLSVKETSDVNRSYSNNSGNKTFRNSYKDKEKEDQLQRFFDTKAKIRRKREGGEIIIQFYDDNNLEEIMKKIA
ncbi:ParB/RepB/Spo0J family partition protein [bacterium]|nr:ParB/RepB/Spo0J family partition protein [bacterium]